VWHPDKWQSGGGAALATAEKEFRRVSAAYEVLGNPSQRRAYDSDPARFESKVAS
jgi:DnaJ-class molecular chaperone